METVRSPNRRIELVLHGTKSMKTSFIAACCNTDWRLVMQLNHTVHTERDQNHLSVFYVYSSSIHSKGF
jgi:hypothetical protein